MTLTICDLGQALISRAREWKFLPVAQFRAIRKPKDLPPDRAKREALLIALMNGELPHSGTLVIMDHEYTVDQYGKEERREVELMELAREYSAAEHDWDFERTNFYGSFLDFADPPAEYKVTEGIDRPWVRLRDIRVPIEKLNTIRSNTHNVGGRPPTKNWDAFWIELVCQLYLNPKPKDDDDDWKELNAVLRRAFTDIDDSAIRAKTRELRQTLRRRNYIKATGK